MSPDLIAFLKAWYEWAMGRAIQNKPFRREIGLCTNVHEWGDHTDTDPEIVNDVWTELQNRLDRDFGDDGYPFGIEDYLERRDAATQHECPKRLAWVRERLIEAGEMADA